MPRSSLPSLVSCLALVIGCSAGGEKAPASPRLDGGGVDDGSVVDGGGITVDAAIDPVAPPKDPATCEDAAAVKAYVGCDFWPTVVGNTVWSIFDYAVVVANTGQADAEVEVTGNGVSKKVTVAAGGLQKIYLPWQPALKGGDWDMCTNNQPKLTASVKVEKGAYHLVSSRPVTVYQFNALEYKGAGGEAGKSWASCPGDAVCTNGSATRGCFSFSNDASLLLPSTAMTGNYRVTGTHGWSQPGGADVHGAYVAITATKDGTNVTFKVGAKGRVLAGTGIAATGPGGTVTLAMNAGDVAQLVGEAKTTSDLSGSLVTADQPIQLIAGIPCLTTPIGTPNCDHVEESIFPAETLGRDYFVTVPTGPRADGVGHVVRLYGNRDGTKLTYSAGAPLLAPATINAGDVVDFGEVSSSFRVTGDQEFAVGSFMLGATRVDPTPTNPKGDPSMSFMTAIEQYRRRYIFLAPDDYDVSFVDIVHADDTALLLDGAAPTETPTKIGATGHSLTRAKLGPGKNGAHELTATKPVGIQVIGYGSFTSYQYPGGLDLKAIAPPPVK